MSRDLIPVTITIPRRLKQKLVERAREEDLDVSKLVRRMIRRDLKLHETVAVED